MALRFAESFDHYGTGSDARLRMLAGPWAELESFTSNVGITGDYARTGSYSLKMGSSAYANRVAIPGSSLDTIGAGFGIRFDSLPIANNFQAFQLIGTDSNPILSVVFQSGGSMDIKRGSQTGTLLGSTDNVLTAGTFNHIECRTLIDDIVGDFELRVNGISKIHLTDLDLGTINISQVRWYKPSTATPITFYIDDIFIWDEVGSYNVTFLGPMRVLTTFCDGDGSPQDWTPVGAATAYQAVNQAVPDDDTSYIGADTVGEKATLTTPSLPTQITDIAGIYVPLYGRIDDAGTGEVNVSMLSVGDALAGGVSTPLTTSYSYWPFIFDYDPHADALWTKTTFEAATIQIEKTL